MSDLMTPTMSVAQQKLLVTEAETLSDLQKAVWTIAEQHMFHSTSASTDTRLLLIITEIVEALECIRDGHDPTHVWHEGAKPEGFPVELADAVIRIMDLAEEEGIDLEYHIRHKAHYNATRAPLHGKAF